MPLIELKRVILDEKIRVHSFGEQDKALSIDADTIRLGAQSVRREDITGIRYWISPIEIYRFRLGRRYYIGLKTATGQFDLILKSFFGLHNAYFSDLCDRIIAEIWDPITDRIWQKNLAVLQAGGAVPFGHCEVSEAGIRITRSDALGKKEQQIICWKDLVYEKKYDRLVLNSQQDPDLWTNLYYRDIWNIDNLITLLDWLTKEGGLAEIQH